MNDIEVLEELLKYKDWYKEHGGEDIGFREIQAIENLLKERQSDKERIKELEEINKAHKKENGELREEIEEKTEIAEWKLEHAYNTGWKACEIISIPKSLIKEQIEELNRKEKEELKGSKGQDRYFIKQMYQYQRKSLEELLNKNVK